MPTDCQKGGRGPIEYRPQLFDFGALAVACRRERRYEFLFTSVPLNVAGAVGSPANAVAIL